MNNVGIVKKIDSLGRLQIPQDVRKRLGLDGAVELIVTKDGLLVKSKKYRLVEVEEKEN